MAPIPHLLLTRFNVRLERFGSPSTDGWLRQRLSLFARLTLMSVQAQETLPDRWLIFCDARSPSWFIDELSVLVDQTWTDIVSVSGYFTAATASSAVAARTDGARHVVTTRLDNDDVIARDFLTQVRDQVRPRNRHFLNVTHGAQISAGRAYRRADPSNAFVSLVEEVNDGGPMTVFVDGHHLLARHGSVQQIKGPPSWVQVVHGGNARNRISGIRMDPTVIQERVPVDLGLLQVSRGALALDRALTASRLGVRVVSNPRRLQWLWRVSRPR